MKTNVLVKFAVVAMAAFGAYAFSGNSADELRSFYVIDGLKCTNILAGCSENPNGPICTIIMNGNSEDVLGLNCSYEIQHDDGNPVKWEPNL